MVLAFFKVSCPTCQYAFPFLERLHKAYGNNGVTLLGVSQNDAKDTAAFNKEYGIAFPVLLDDTRSYVVSNAFGLTNVPSIFYVAQDGNIEISSVGWMKADFEEISRRMAEAGRKGSAPAVMFRPGEDVPGFPGGLRVEELAAGLAGSKASNRASADGRGRPSPHQGRPQTRHFHIKSGSLCSEMVGALSCIGGRYILRQPRMGRPFTIRLDLYQFRLLQKKSSQPARRFVGGDPNLCDKC